MAISSPSKNFLLLFGLSGSGKSTAMKCLEDLGFYCIDNLPPALFLNFAHLCHEAHYQHVAIAVREATNLENLKRVLEVAQDFGYTTHSIFFEASEEIIIRRYSETRRKHPYAKHGQLTQAISQERKELSELRNFSQMIIDTSSISPHNLMSRLQKIFYPEADSNTHIHLCSFGFKNGIASDADFVFDVRFLPNPYYDLELRHLTGTTSSVQEHVLSQQAGQQYLKELIVFLEKNIALFQSSGKQTLNIAIGCTGGHHRSVTIVERLAQYFKQKGLAVHTLHRDIHIQRKAAPLS